MMPPDAYEIPSWALAILFWRKVLAVESKGIPGTRGPRHDHDLATETHFGDPNSAEGTRDSRQAGRRFQQASSGRARFVWSTLPASAVRVEDLCEPWMKPMLRWQYGLWMTSDVPRAGEGVPAAPALGRGRRPDGRRHGPVT